MNISSTIPTSITIEMFPTKNHIFPIDLHRFLLASYQKINYGFSIRFFKKSDNYRISKEFLEAECEFFEFNQEENEEENPKKLGEGSFIISRTGNKFSSHIKTTPEYIATELLKNWQLFILNRSRLSKQLFLELPTLMPPLIFLSDFIEDTGVYDILPNAVKGASSILGKNELESDGSNLALILMKILKNPDAKKKISGLITEMLPFFEDISVEKFGDKFLIPFLKESYCNEKLPVSMVSDGTINLMGLILALYFEDKKLIIMEEPGRFLHPYLISKMIDIMKDSSETDGKQMIFTTHNPEVLKHIDVKDILLVSRDAESVSRIKRPSESEEVQIFLKNEMGIDELFVKQLLE
ncbi:MAG: ATP-binding protein [Candidatus Bathyarchaeota archaeon]